MTNAHAMTKLLTMRTKVEKKNIIIYKNKTRWTEFKQSINELIKHNKFHVDVCIL